MVRVLQQPSAGTLRAIDRIRELVYQPEAGLSLSFEFFPPKEEAGEKTFWHTLNRLLPLNPAFVSVTYGAGYSDRSRTRDLVKRLQASTATPVSPHLTCVGHRQEDLHAILEDYWQAGVRKILAVRGDLAPGERPTPGLEHAIDLVQMIRNRRDFQIFVAAYPETHPTAPSAQRDLENLKRKIDAGATAAISQFFFDNGQFLRFRDRCRRAGIEAEIIPGILPVTHVERTMAFAQRCGSKIPDWLPPYFEGLDEEPETRNLIAAAMAIDQVQELHIEGVNHFHFYTLNRCDLTYAICRSLGARSRVGERRG
jgi:methylenetetrahydrofolate reductase (NADPH)